MILWQSLTYVAYEVFSWYFHCELNSGQSNRERYVIGVMASVFVVDEFQSRDDNPSDNTDAVS